MSVEHVIDIGVHPDDKASHLLSVEQAKIYIYNIDFSRIINKMHQFEGWRYKEAVAVSDQYREFLLLNKKHPAFKPLPPSEDIDEFWHRHVLDTANYRRDTQVIFGEYFDHYPYLGIDENTDMKDLNNYFQKTKSLYQEEFGKPLLPVRLSGFWGFVVRCLECVESITYKIRRRGLS